MTILGMGGGDEEPGPPEDQRAVYRRRRLAVAGIALAVVVIVVVGVVAAARYANGLFGNSADYSGAGSGSVLVVVRQGDSISSIGGTLSRAGVVRSSGAFTSAADDDPRSSNIGPGTYRLHKHMKASLALALILNPASLVDYRVAIPEGYTTAAILARLSADAHISLTSLKDAVANPASLGLPSWAQSTSPNALNRVEGFLFPATYDVQPGTTATQILSQMVARFEQSAKTDGLLSGAHKLGLTPYQVVTLASMVQREGRLTADFPKIAEVFTNRLSHQMRMDSDATLYYVLGPDHGPLSQTDLQSSSPYNTRRFAGLPPSPINSPGDAALLAVLHHPSGPYLYFVTIDKAGHTAFATTLSQFNRLVAQSKANGVS